MAANPYVLSLAASRLGRGPHSTEFYVRYQETDPGSFVTLVYQNIAFLLMRLAGSQTIGCLCRICLYVY